MKKYDPGKIESKWQRIWEEKLKAKALDFDKKREKFYALVEFPYPSGEGLHIGHAFTFSILDAYVRKKRMEGVNVLYPMGWDAFGLPTENYAIKSGVHPAVATRKNTDQFRAQMKRLGFAYNWAREVNTTDPDYYHWTQWIFIKLFKKGLAYKKKMPINWCPSCRIGLANEEVVNGRCERCGATVGQKELDQWLLRITAYADRLADELDLVDFPESVVAAQRNWIGRKEWIDITYPIKGTKEVISVSTTRPDTNFGATFVVLAPEHPFVEKLLKSPRGWQAGVSAEAMTPPRWRLKRKEIRTYVNQAKKKTELERLSEGRKKTGVFTGLYALNRLTGRKMPIWITDFVMMTVGTGAVVGVPGHDLRDFEFAQQFGLPVVRVVVGSDGDTGQITRKEQVEEHEGTMINSEFLDGLDIHQATKVIMDYLEEKGWGKRVIRYHLRDWIFSRQHYWGEPIPMVYCESCAEKGVTWWDTTEAQNSKLKTQNYNLKLKTNEEEKGEDTSEVALNPPAGGEGTPRMVEELKKTLAGWFPVSEKDLPVKLPEVKRYQPSGTGESPLAQVKDWVKTTCPVCGGPAQRETDTMPNWAGSSWYYLAYVFGHKLGNQKSNSKNQKLGQNNIFQKYKDGINYWMPVDLYLGGAEHTTLHLLYSRFWYKFLSDLGVVPGKEPYQARRVHGVVLGEDGFRMSKSRGNVINPEDVVKKFGVDTLRVYLMFMGPYDQTMPWSTQGVRGVYRFLSRVWALVIASQGDTSEVARRDSSDGEGIGEQRGGGKKEAGSDLKRLIHKTIKKVTEDIEAMKLNTAIAALMEYLNTLHATRYPGKAEDPRLKHRDTLHAKARKEAIKALLLLLAPFAPYITEELWSRLAAEDLRRSLDTLDSSRVVGPRHKASGQKLNQRSGPEEVEPSNKTPTVSRGVQSREAGQGSTSMNLWSIHAHPWPQYDSKLIKEEEVSVVIEVNGKVRGQLTINNKQSTIRSKVEKLARGESKVKKHLEGKKIKRVIFLPGKLINFVVD